MHNTAKSQKGVYARPYGNPSGAAMYPFPTRQRNGANKTLIKDNKRSLTIPLLPPIATPLLSQTDRGQNLKKNETTKTPRRFQRPHGDFTGVAPVCLATNAHTSEYSSMTFSVGFPAPCPAFLSMRISRGEGFDGETSRCNPAINL